MSGLVTTGNNNTPAKKGSDNYINLCIHKKITHLYNSYKWKAILNNNPL